MRNEPRNIIVSKVIPVGTGGSDAVELLRPSLEALSSDVSIEPVCKLGVEETVSSLGNGRPETGATVAIVCTASWFRSEDMDEPVTELPNARLFVVDVDDSHDPAEIQMAPHVMYIHAESPKEQILSALRAALPSTGTDTGAVSNAYPASEAELLPAASPPFLRQLFVEAPLPLLAAEAETGTIVAVNDRASEFFDRSQESLLGTTQEKLHPTDADTDYRDGFQQSVETGGTGSYTQHADPPFYIETTGDERVPVEIIDTTVQIGGRTYVLGAFLDTSDRPEEQAVLRRRSAAIEASLTGISILDSDGTYTYMNEAHATIFGYDAETLVGESWRFLYDESTQSEIEAGPFEDLEQTGSWEGELTGVARNGDPVEQHVSLTRLPDGGLVCVNRDISDRKRFERQLESIRRAAQSFMYAEDRDTVIDRTIEVITETLDRPLVGYHRYHGTDDEFRTVSVSPSSRELFDDIPTFERGEGLVWRAFEAGEMQYYPDLTELEDVYNPDTPIRSELHLPVSDHGVFLIGSTATDDVSANERKLLEIVINHVRTALDLVERRTELDQARQRAEAEREQLRRVIDTVPQFIFAKNDAGEFIFANEAVAEAYGTTPSALEGKTDADFAPDDADIEVFIEDDRTVIETGEPVYRYGETLTDVDGTERILETIKVPFDPVGTEGPAVLGSSTDITELERAQAALARQRRLKALYRLESELSLGKTPAEIHEAGLDAVLEGLEDVVAATYLRTEDDSTLHRKMAAPTEGSQFPETVTVNDQAYWRAFSTGQRQELDDVAGDRGIVVPIGSTGLLAVSGVEDVSESVTEFLRSVADTLVIAIDRAEQNASTKELNMELSHLEAEFNSVATRLENLAAVAEHVLKAESQSEIDELLVEFLDTNWEYGWIGDYKPQTKAIVPRRVTDEDGPATELREDPSGEMPPALEAATTRSPAYIDRTVIERGNEWASTMLRYGYHSVLSAPLVDRGTIYGVIEVASTDADAYGARDIAAVRFLGRLAGRRLKNLNTDSPGVPAVDTVEASVSFSDARPLFPSLPADASIEVLRVLTVDSSEKRLQLTVRGFSHSEFEAYLSKTPGLYGADVGNPAGRRGFEATVRVDTNRREPTDVFFERCASKSARVSRVRADPTEELVTITTDDQSDISAVIDALTACFEGATFVAKRTGQSDDRRPFDPTESLTGRQREILQVAYDEGYYDRPKGINGKQLAELFGISHSTVNEHLRVAERKIVAAAIGQ